MILPAQNNEPTDHGGLHRSRSVLKPPVCQQPASNGLNHQQAGYWGSAASVITILLLGWMCERTKFIRQFLEGRPLFIYERGALDRTRMEKHMVDESDLESAAREYGLASYHDFSTIVIEGNGAVTGVVSTRTGKKL
jgi:uncharacterized membrane protein YcaP (DUF421 family)